MRDRIVGQKHRVLFYNHIYKIRKPLENRSSELCILFGFKPVKSQFFSINFDSVARMLMNEYNRRTT